MNKKKATNFKEFESELLRDQEIQKEYLDLKLKYDLVHDLIKHRNQHI